MVGGLYVTSLEKIRKDIESPSEDLRFAAWFGLYSLVIPEARQETERILHGHDPILKVLFCRFLAHIQEERSLQYLTQLLQDENNHVFETAKKAFARSHYNKKMEQLLPLLDSPRAQVRRYAIETLASAGETKLVEPLLNMIPTADEELLLIILRALRYLPDRRVIPVILPFLHDAREEIQYRSLMVLGANYEAKLFQAHKILLKIIHHPSPVMRQAALWILRRRPTKHDLDQLFLLVKQDPEPIVRQEALMTLRHFPNEKTIENLMNTCIADGNKAVILKAEAILMEMPKECLKTSLRKMMSHSQLAIRHKAMLYLAELERGSRSLCTTFLKRLHTCQNEPERIAILEALGNVQHQDAIPDLEKLVTGPLLTAYAALNALLNLYSKNDIARIVHYLEQPEINLLLKQVILRHLINHNAYDALDTRLTQDLIGLLSNENLNIRYLAAQTLRITNNSVTLKPLLQAMLRETDPVSLDYFRGSIVQLFIQQPVLSIDLLREYRNDRDVVPLLLKLSQEAGMKGPHALSLAKALLDPALDLLSSGFKPLLIEVFSAFFTHHRLSLETLFLELKERRSDINFLISIMNRLEGKIQFKLPFSILESWLTEHDQDLQGSIINLLGNTGDRGAIPLLVSILCDEKRIPHHALAARSLRRLSGLETSPP